MHQDYPFYSHDGPNFVDCLLHLTILRLTMVARGVPGSHQAGPFELITGDHTRPYLPPNTYSGFTTLEGDSSHSKECDLLQLLYYHWSDIN